MELQARFDSIVNSRSNDILAKILIKITEKWISEFTLSGFFSQDFKYSTKDNIKSISFSFGTHYIVTYTKSLVFFANLQP
jgi:hypothetical protein